MADKKTSLIDELFSDSGSLDKERVVRVLKLILVIQRGEHSVFFKKDVALKTEDKVLAYVLVKKLLKIEGVEKESGVSGKEVSKKTGVKQGSVDPTIQKLKVDGLLVGGGSNYEIPPHQTETVLERLEKYISKK